MSWNGGTYPDGNKSMVDNRVGIAENFDYISDSMGDTDPTRDHYWNDADSTKDGFHRQANMPTKGAVDATIEHDGVLYVKTTSHVSGDQHSLMYRQDKTFDIAFPITPGITWGFAVFTLVAGVPTMVNSKNLTVAYTAPYDYTFTFTVAAPHENYMVFGSSEKYGGVVQTLTLYNSTTPLSVNSFSTLFTTGSGGSMIPTVSKAYVMVVV